MDSDQGDQVEVNANGIEVVMNLHAVPDFYRRDIVTHKKSGSIGMVLSGCDGEIDDDDVDYDDDDDEDEEEDDNNKDGGCNERAKSENLETDQQVKVLSLDRKRKFWNVNDIMLVDRMLLHGEYVAYVTDPNGQVGVVQDVNVSADLLAPDGSILKGVSSRDLKCPFEFVKGDYVMLGSWVGKVDDFLLNVTVLTDDGSSCKVINADPLHLNPGVGKFAYYPGQRVRASSSSVFGKSWWLSSFWKANTLEGTVTQVTVGSVFIKWIASSGYGPNSSTVPYKEQSPNNLKKVSSCLAHAYWEVGAWCFFRPSVLQPSSIAQDSAKSEARQTNGCESEPMDPVATIANPRGKKENLEQVYMITNTSRKVSVLWQDGTMGHCIDSKLLFFKDIDELVAQQYVWEKAHDDISETIRRRCGVIQSVNPEERTACVRWLEDPGEFDTEETVSVYELEGHPDYNYLNGELVFRLSVATSAIDEKHSGGEMDDVSCVGNITGLKNGDIEVTWANGMVSTVGPQEIFVVNRDNANDFGRIPAISLVLAYIDFVERLAARFFLWTKDVIDFLFDSQGEVELQGQGTTDMNDSGGRKGEEFADGTAPVTSDVVSEGGGSCNLETETDDQTLDFKRFDTATDPLDHHFLGTSGQVNNGRKWLKKVQQDWRILENNLPGKVVLESIMVFMCEFMKIEWISLRAVIVGPSGTPYQDGLFFFDFYLPPDYPDVPPSGHYHSGGWRINPNLYQGGKVCLSLLNTWSGNTNEVWDPTSSSILQVLVSLQGLVLTSRPYFNEPGYDKQVGTAEGEKNSLSYNESTFLLSCKTMMYLMRRSPKDFEKLVKDHFKRRGWYILKACDAYMRGSLIGSLSGDALAATEETLNSTSVGFKLMLAKIMPKLYSALSEVGADCAEFRHLLPGEK